jgi:serine phosphatase RsbU (regulator of sigma subunit)
MSDLPLDILRHAFGSNLEAALLGSLFATAEQQTFAPNEVILAQGETGSTCYVLLSGQVTVSRFTDESQSERNIAHIEPGQLFGELALLDSAPRMATCRAATAVSVLAIDQPLFQRLLHEDPAVANTLILQIINDMRRQDKLAIADLQAKNSDLQAAYADLRDAQQELVEKERLEHELALAAQVQRDLLPDKLPSYADFAFAAYQQPARQVGGDFYDVIELDEDHLGLLLADVADKGMHAALIMAVTRTLFKVSAGTALSPAAVVQAVHRGLLDTAPDSMAFVTAFYGVLHRPSRLLTYVRAAQERPLLLQPGRPVIELPGDGRFMGMLPGLALTEHQVCLSSGDRLLLYSDGVTDAVNSSGEPYDRERLQSACLRAWNLPAAEFVVGIVDDVACWTAGEPPFDDITLLAVEVR